MSPMSAETISKLVNLEYHLCFLQGELQEAAQEIRRSGVDGCHRASRALLEARNGVRLALKRLDGPLTEAAIQAESLEPAPF